MTESASSGSGRPDGSEPSAESQEVVVDSEREWEAQRNVAERLRSDRSLSTMVSWARHTPEVFSEVYDFIARKDELLDGSRAEGQLHREYTPVLAGIMNSERGMEVVDLAIDRSVEELTAEVKERLRVGDAYVHELVVGSGPHAQIYSTEKAVANPGHPALTVERDRRIGGQFALAESAVWNLNTRTRPEDALSSHLPGTEGSLNTLGRGAVQQSDLTGEAYGSQDRLADAVRMNHALVSRVVNRTEVVAVRDSADETLPGRMQVEMRDTQTGEIFFLQTDRVVLTTGLGEPRTGLEQADPASQDLVARNLDQFERTGRSKIMLLEQAVQRLGDKHEPFPLRDMGEVAVVGPGDSGAIVAEYLLGYGPAPRKSVAGLDRVEKVHWIGQKSKTREDFDVRQRYKMLGLEMPREHAPDYTTRIEPAEGRCFRIEEEGDKVRLYYRNKAGEESSVLVDHVVLATGYVDRTDEIVQVGAADGEQETVTDDDGMPIAKRYAGTEVYKAGPNTQLELTDVKRNDSPAMQRMDVKRTVAVWAFADETEALARKLAAADVAEGNPDDMLSDLRTPEPVPLPELRPAAEPSPLYIAMQELSSRDRLPAGVSGEDVLRFAVGEHLAGYAFPKDTEGFKLHVQRATNGAPQFTVDITPGTACQQEEYCRMLRELMNDRVMQDMLQRLTEKRVSRRQQVDIDIPLRDGTVVLEDIEYHIPRSH